MNTQARAHRAVSNALKSGELERQPCEVCGSELSEAHHDDYDAPLAVIWLCRRHHKRLHAERGDVAADTGVKMLRVNLTPSQRRELRIAALEKDTTMQALIGAIVAVYLEERKEFS